MNIRVLIGLILVMNVLANQPLYIESVSTFKGSTSSSLTGSIKGGTTLYIKGLGFDRVPTNNQVTVGGFPCTISA